MPRRPKASYRQPINTVFVSRYEEQPEEVRDEDYYDRSPLGCDPTIGMYELVRDGDYDDQED